ncbi:MAG: glucose-6-phosphate isomerase [Spirochaetales bacterium]|jgi:glucose-6-phosphate isomerase|nr:glucose-6-phosphate isomerase [Spirochaetales bacterium]
MGVSYKNLDTLAAFARLKGLGRTDELLTEERIRSAQIPAGSGLSYNYAAKLWTGETLGVLQELADEAELIPKYRALLDGEVMNTGEARMVLHQLARGQLGRDVIHGGKNLRVFYEGEFGRIKDFAEKVHGGELRGSTGKVFETVVQIGIGGSDLGPRALYLALRNFCAGGGSGPGSGQGQRLEARFISNVDPDDASDVLAGINPETSLFIIVSKSGTTQETLTNEAFVRRALSSSRGAALAPEKHIIAVTSQASPMAKSSSYLAAFFMDDFIGGRYSATSAVGAAVLTLAFGAGVVEELLGGAAQTDRLSLESSVEKNAALLDALLGVYERNVLGFPSTAILPYSQALSRFPAHLQQLDMESNGKSVNRFGEPVSYATGPLVFGEPGTNGQHSFYQLLHQGTDIIPLQFVGFRASQRGEDLEFEGSSSQKKLCANLAAQIVAFARGKKDSNPNKSFSGGRPSSLLWAERLTPAVLGSLLAHFENKVMFQGFLWNINSFDQEGVQLGKILTTQLLGGKAGDKELSVYAGLLGAG